MPSYRVRITQGYSLLLALIAAALADTAVLVVAIEVKVPLGAGLLTAGLVTLLALQLVVLLQLLSPRSVVALGDDGLRLSRRGRADFVLPWSELQRARWTKEGSGQVLELQQSDGRTVVWTQSAYLAGGAEFSALATAVLARVAPPS